MFEIETTSSDGVYAVAARLPALGTMKPAYLPKVAQRNGNRG
jgi:hypothetical protein